MREVVRERKRRDLPRGAVVELVRLILVALFAVGGWQIGEQGFQGQIPLLLGIALGSMIGYVIGGVIGRRTAVAVREAEVQFKELPAGEKRMLSKARQILVSELTFAVDASLEKAEAMVDKVLEDSHKAISLNGAESN